jgi:hypothetical protein
MITLPYEHELPWWECAEEREIKTLIARHGRSVDAADLPWLGGIFGKLCQGYSLTAEQIARVSAIRAELARRGKTDLARGMP